MIQVIAYLLWGFVAILLVLNSVGEYWPLFVISLVLIFGTYYVIVHLKYKIAMKRLKAYKARWEEEHREELAFIEEFEKKYKDSCIYYMRFNTSSAPLDELSKYKSLKHLKEFPKLQQDRFGRYHVIDFSCNKEILKDGSTKPYNIMDNMWRFYYR